MPRVRRRDWRRVPRHARGEGISGGARPYDADVGYRDEEEALRLRLQMAEAERDAHRHKAEAAEAQLARAVAGAPTPEGMKHDSWLTAAKVFLWLHFGGWVVFLLVSVPAYIGIAHEDPPFGHELDPTVQGLLMAAMVNAFFAPVGIGSAIGAFGLARGRAWGWWVSIVVFGISCACGCWPLGVGGIIILLRGPVRAAYLGSR